MKTLILIAVMAAATVGGAFALRTPPPEPPPRIPTTTVALPFGDPAQLADAVRDPELRRRAEAMLRARASQARQRSSFRDR